MSVESAKPKRSLWRHPLVLIPAGLVLVLALAVAALVVAPPTDLARDQLIRIVRDTTGRELKVAGPAKLTLYPKASLALERVSLAGPPGAVGPELLRAESIVGEMRLASLLRGRTELSQLQIVRPVLTIRPEDRPLLDTVGHSKSGGIGDKADQLALREVVITDGSVNYLVKQPNPIWRIDQLSASFADVTGNGETKGSGGFRWRNERVTFNSLLADARAYGRGDASALSVNIGAKHLALDLKGELSPKDNGQVKGALVVKIDSLRDFVRWLDVDPGAYALKGPATLEGPVTANQAQVGLERVRLKMNAGESIWDTQVRFADARPQVTGNVVWSQLDLQKLLGEIPKMPALAVQARSSQAGTTIPSAWQALGSQLAALNASPGVALSSVAAAAAPARPERNTWSIETFDLDALTAVNLNLTTSAETVTHGAVQMRDARADILLHDGRLTYTLKQVEIDKGRATGRLDVDSTAKPAKVALSLSASELPAEKLLSQILENAFLAGATKLDVVVAGRGRNAQDILGSLEGTANLTIEKGRLIGFDLRRALLEWWGQHTFDRSQRTNFDRISGNYAIRNGVARTVGDLSLTGPEVEILSNGTVTLSSQTINQKVRLKAWPPPRHVAVPLRVDGSWERPDVTWDWLSIFQDPSISGSPTSVTTSPQPIPADVKAAIQQLLSGSGASQLPAETRTLLESLGG